MSTAAGHLYRGARPRLAGLHLGFFLLAAACLRADTVSDPLGRFSADFPAEVVRESSDTGGSTLYMVHCDADASTSYFVMFSDAAPGAWDKLGGLEASYSAIAAGALKAQPGKVVSKTDCTSDTHAGKEFRFDLTGIKMVCRVRYYICGNRLYQVLYTGKPGTELGKDATCFMESFHISGP